MGFLNRLQASSGLLGDECQESLFLTTVMPQYTVIEAGSEPIFRVNIRPSFDYHKWKPNL